MKRRRNKRLLEPAPNAEPVAAPVVEIRDHIISAGLRKSIKLKDLVERVDAIDGNTAMVAEAVHMALDPINKKALARAKTEAADGHEMPVRSDHFVLAVAMTVASMNLDRIQEGDDAGGKYSKLKAPQIDWNARTQRVTSVVASILQEMVAYNVISAERVEANFGREIAQLTREAARITRLPTTIRMPDVDGRMTMADVKFNQVQAEYGQDLICASDNPSRVWLIKTADALQQLRTISEIKDSSARLQVALHIQGLYLPLLREGAAKNIDEEKQDTRLFQGLSAPPIAESGIRAIQYEMQDLLLLTLDPDSYRKISRGFADFGIDEKDETHGRVKGVVAIGHKIFKALEGHGYKTEVLDSIAGRRKEAWSIWDKNFRGVRKALDRRLKTQVKRLETRHKAGAITHAEFQELMVGAHEAYDRRRVPVVRWRNMELSKTGDVVAFRLLINHPDSHFVHRLVRGANAILSESFEPMDRRTAAVEESLGRAPGTLWKRERVDYIGAPKENGYQAFHNRFYIPSTTGKLQKVEVHILSTAMHDKNTYGLTRHAAHKARSNVIRDGQHALSHPARRPPSTGEERLAIVTDVLSRAGARLKGDVLPKHSGTDFIIVSTKGGYLRRLKRGATAEDLAREVHSGLLAETHGMKIDGESFYGDAYKEKLREPLEHASFVEFLKPPVMGYEPVRKRGPQTPGAGQVHAAI